MFAYRSWNTARGETMIRNILNIKCSECGKVLATLDTYKETEDTSSLKKNITEMCIFPSYCQECYERSVIL